MDKIRNVLGQLGGISAIALDGMLSLRRRPLQLDEFRRQAWFITKVSAIPLVLISVPFGMIIALHVGSFFRQLGAEAQIGSALFLATVREQAPIATALLISGAGGSAMTADIGSRRIRDEIDAMQVMGVNPVQRLVMPRVLAAVVLAVALDAVVSVAGIAGGWFFATRVDDVSSSAFFASFDELSQLADLWMALIKAACFGFIAGVVACWKGIHAKGGPKGVGDAVNQAVVITFVLLFFVNFVLTVVYFNFVPQKV